MNLIENEKKALAELKHKITKEFPDAVIIIYGSKARGDDDDFSDIDILLLLNRDIERELKETIYTITYDIELKYNIVFGTIIENKDFWQTPLARAMPFHCNVDREGVVL